MGIDELPPLSVKNRFMLNDENSKRLFALLARARLTTNKEEARHLRTKADTLLFTESLAQLLIVGAFSRLTGTNIVWMVGRVGLLELYHLLKISTRFLKIAR